MPNNRGQHSLGRTFGYRHFLAFVLLLMWSLPGNAEYQAVAAVPGLEQGERFVHCFASPSSMAGKSIQQMLEADLWERVPEGAVNYGFTRRECWFHTRVRNVGPQPLTVMVSTDYALLDWVEMSVLDLDRGQIIDTQHTGQSIPYNQWPVQNQNPSFILSIPEGAHWQLIWRVRSAYSLQMGTRFALEKDFFTRQEMMLGIHSLFFGAMLVMAVYNLFLYFAVRERAYLLYVFWATTMTLFQLVYWGFGQRFFWPHSDEFSRVAMVALLPIAIIFGPWFTRTFLQLDVLGAKDDKALRLISLWGLVLLLGLGFIDHYYMVPVCTLTILLMVVFIAIVSVRRLRAGDRSALYFTIAWVCFICGSGLMAFNKFGLLPVTLVTENMVELGTSLEVLLLSLALAERIKMLKQAGQKAKDQQARAEFEAIKARELSQTKSEFLAAMSHEIRTPMNGVLAMADLLRHSKLSPEPASYVDTIFHSTKSLLTVINDILDYTRIESGKMAFDPIDVDVESLVDDCVMLFSVQSRNRGLPLFVSVETSVPARLRLDPVRVKQIINNLLGNAFKFTENGWVKLTLKVSQPDGAGPRSLVIAVEDTGIGISEVEQSRLFTAFSQADRSIVRRYGGSGLGLTICKKLAELMHGGIEMHSQPGTGSRFVVSLPLKQEHWPSAEESSLLGKRVLVVEAEGIAREGYREVLQRWGMQVQTASCLTLDEQFKHQDVIIMGGTCASECDRLGDLKGLPPVLQLGTHYAELATGSEAKPHFLHLPVALGKMRLALTQMLAPEAVDHTHTQAAEGSDHWPQLHVLVAEDNPVNQLVAKRLLEKLNIVPVIVNNGKEALDYVPENRVDIILMDCDMPVMNGYEATRAIRNETGEQTWIIGLSAKAAEDEVKQAQVSGMNDYLTKPVTLKQLRAAIQRSTPVQSKAIVSASPHHPVPGAESNR